jgi:hypothetical protein
MYTQDASAQSKHSYTKRIAAIEAQCGLLTVNKSIQNLATVWSPVCRVLEQIFVLSVSTHSYIGEKLCCLSYKLILTEGSKKDGDWKYPV